MSIAISSEASYHFSVVRLLLFFPQVAATSRWRFGLRVLLPFWQPYTRRWCNSGPPIPLSFFPRSAERLRDDGTTPGRVFSLRNGKSNASIMDALMQRRPGNQIQPRWLPLMNLKARCANGSATLVLPLCDFLFSGKDAMNHEQEVEQPTDYRLTGIDPDVTEELLRRDGQLPPLETQGANNETIA